MMTPQSPHKRTAAPLHRMTSGLEPRTHGSLDHKARLGIDVEHLSSDSIPPNRKRYWHFANGDLMITFWWLMVSTLDMGRWTTKSSWSKILKDESMIAFLLKNGRKLLKVPESVIDSDISVSKRMWIHQQQILWVWSEVLTDKMC